MSNAQAQEHPLVREGSSLHYSLLWTESLARERFCHRLTLIKAMATTLDDVQDPQVAQKKIHWWHEELQRMQEGVARHPATQSNQATLTGSDAGQYACLEIVSVASEQRFNAPQTAAQRHQHLARSFLARLALVSHALSDDTADLDITTHSHAAALALGQHEQLVRLPNLIHRGLPVFSDECYSQFNIRPHDLAEHIRVMASVQNDADAPAFKSIPVVSEMPGRQQLLAYAIQQCHESMIEAVNAPQTTQRYRKAPLLPIWRLLVLRKHQLALWSHRQPDLLRERMTLTPISKLFRAWQHRR